MILQAETLKALIVEMIAVEDSVFVTPAASTVIRVWREKLEATLSEAEPVKDETPCPKREDKQHCNCWYDGERCCACGDEAAPVERAETPLDWSRLIHLAKNAEVSERALREIKTDETDPIYGSASDALNIGIVRISAKYANELLDLVARLSASGASQRLLT
jgi:hypothetical protein